MLFWLRGKQCPVIVIIETELLPPLSLWKMLAFGHGVISGNILFSHKRNKTVNTYRNFLQFREVSSMQIIDWIQARWGRRNDRNVTSKENKRSLCPGPFIYGRPFVSTLWHDIRAVFSHVYLQSFLLHDIRALFCHVYLRSFLLCGVFIPEYMTIFLETRRGTQRGYSSKPLNIALLNVF